MKMLPIMKNKQLIRLIDWKWLQKPMKMLSIRDNNPLIRLID